MELTLDLGKMFKQIVGIVRGQKEFLKVDSQDVEITETLSFHAITTLIGILLSTVFYYLVIPVFFQFFPNEYLKTLMPGNFLDLLPFLVFSFFFSLFLGAVWSVLFMFWVRLFKGKITFKESYKTFIYARTSTYIFRWIPVLNLVSMIQAIYFIYLSLVKNYKFKKFKAITAILLAVGLIILGAYLIVVTYQQP